MPIDHITYLKTGGYLKINELTRNEHFGAIEQGIFGTEVGKERQPLYKTPDHWETSRRYYAPSRSLKARLRVMWWNIKEKRDE